jgi:hypothetical protein
LDTVVLGSVNAKSPSQQTDAASLKLLKGTERHAVPAWCGGQMECYKKKL